MKYPRVLSEEQTLERCFTQSIGRFGDGELRVALGGGCVSQSADKSLASELRALLKKPGSCMAGIPNWKSKTPKAESWANYGVDRFVALYGAEEYASAFISRPDSAPWIDVPEYWERVRDLWRDQDIVFVGGDRRSLRTEQMSQARSIRMVDAPTKHAYAEINRIEEEVGKHTGPVIMCLGATASALAARLDRNGVRALDLGHIGMFMRHAGAYKYTIDDMTTGRYRDQLKAMHADGNWGADGAKHAAAVMEIHQRMKPATILDYGCSEQKLAAALAPLRVQGYDPGIVGREAMPKPCDLVVCTDVLEHVEPKRLDSVLDHIFRITGMGAYFVISTRPARASLPDGRNAHLTVESHEYWREKLQAVGWIIEKDENRGKESAFWLNKA